MHSLLQYPVRLTAVCRSGCSEHGSHGCRTTGNSFFIVAPANDIATLPLELIRKGRFDEVFFIDLPSVDARRQIFAIHLQRRNRNPADFELDVLMDFSKDLTGSEIEQTIVSGLFHAFAAKRELTRRIFSTSSTKPIRCSP